MEKLSYSFLTILFSSIFVENSKGEDFQHIQLGATFSPAYSYRTLNGGNNETLIRRNESEIAKFGYSVGLNIFFERNKQAGIESGILYSNKGYCPERQHIDGIDVAYWYRDVYSYHYIDIPLKVRFCTRGQKVRFTTSIGLTTDFLVNATTARSTSSIMLKECIRINLSPTISAGVDYKVTSKSLIRLEPIFQYGLISTYKSENTISEHLFSIGMNLSYSTGIK